MLELKQDKHIFKSIFDTQFLTYSHRDLGQTHVLA